MFAARPLNQNFGQKPNYLILYILGFGIPGFVFFCIGFWAFGTQVLSEQSSILVDLEITQLIMEVDSTNRVTYAPEFTITGGDYSGKKIISKISSNPPLYAEGDQIKGLFDPVSGEIQSNKISTRKKLLPAIFIIVGALLICGGFALYFRQKSKQRYVRPKNNLRWFS